MIGPLLSGFITETFGFGVAHLPYVRPRSQLSGPSPQPDYPTCSLGRATTAASWMIARKPW